MISHVVFGMQYPAPSAAPAPVDPVTDQLVTYFDIADASSYPGTGTTVTNLVDGGNNATIYNTGDVSYNATTKTLDTSGTNIGGYLGYVADTMPYPAAFTFEIGFIPKQEAFDQWGRWVQVNTRVNQGYNFEENQFVLQGYFAYPYTSAVTSKFSDGTPAIMTVVADRTNLDVYVDGVYIESHAITTTRPDTGGNSIPDFTVIGGNDPFGSSIVPQGTVPMQFQYLRMYDKALSSEEVIQNYNANAGNLGLTPITPAPAPSYDADAQAFIDATSISGTEADAINQLVLDMKSTGVWSLMDAVYPMVGATANEHKYNLMDPRDADDAFRLLFNGTWTHASTGATPNGSSWANTKYITDAHNMTQNSNHLSYYSRTNGQGVMLGHNFGSRMWMAPNYNGSVGYSPQQTNNATSWGAYADNRRFWLSTRVASNQSKLFRDGTLERTISDFSAGLQPATIILNDRSKNNLTDPQPNGNYYGGECAFASMGQGLDDTQAADFSAAVVAYQTALGRNI